MALLYITEGFGVGGGGNNAAQALAMPPLGEQTVKIGGESAASAPFHPAAAVIRIRPDADCSLAWGTDPVATVNMLPMGAGQTEYFTVTPGTKMRVAVISNSVRSS